MKQILFLLFFALSLSVKAQEPVVGWLKGYGGNIDDAVVKPVIGTSDGGVIISISSNSDSGTGNIDSFCAMSGNRTIFIKYNPSASIIEWSKCYSYGMGGDTSLLYMFPQTDGGSVFGGEYLSAYGWGFYICKQDAMGNILWSHGYSQGESPLLHDMIPTNDGGYIMIGDVYYSDTNFIVHNSGSLNADIGVVKVDSVGNKQWSKAIGGSENEEAAKVVAAPGGYYVVGATSSFDSDCIGKHLNYDAYVARLDEQGNILWHRDLGGDGPDNGTYAWPDGNGGILIAASSASSNGDVHYHIGNYDMWLLDVDSNSNIVWDNCYGGPGDEYSYSLCKANDKTIWLTGISKTQGGQVDTAYGDEDAWVVHVDSMGIFLSSKVLGGSRQDEGSMIFPLANNSVITGGFYTTNDGSFSSLETYGGTLVTDAYVANFSPWTTEVKVFGGMRDEIEMYPNPANKNITFQAKDNRIYDLLITDIFGKNVYINRQIRKAEIFVKEWPRGLYYAYIVNKEGQVDFKKIVVQ